MACLDQDRDWGENGGDVEGDGLDEAFMHNGNSEVTVVGKMTTDLHKKGPGKRRKAYRANYE